MFQLISQPQPIADWTFEIRFLDASVEPSAFALG